MNVGQKKCLVYHYCLKGGETPLQIYGPGDTPQTFHPLPRWQTHSSVVKTSAQLRALAANAGCTSAFDTWQVPRGPSISS